MRKVIFEQLTLLDFTNEYGYCLLFILKLFINRNFYLVYPNSFSVLVFVKVF